MIKTYEFHDPLTPGTWPLAPGPTNRFHTCKTVPRGPPVAARGPPRATRGAPEPKGPTIEPQGPFDMEEANCHQ